MKPNPFLKALSIFLLLVFVVVGGMYFFSPASLFAKYSTSYQEFPDPKPMPEDEPANVVEVPGFIEAFDISADGSLAAIATSKKIILYDLQTLKEVHRLPLDEQVFQVQFSPDGSKLAASGYVTKYWDRGSQHITVWDIASWKISYEYKSDTQLYNLPSALTWSPDNKQIAFSKWEHGLTVIDVNTGNTVATLEDLIVSPLDLSWSPDGSRLISTGDQGYGLRRWRVDTGKWVRLFDTRIQSAQQVQWSPDGKKIASGHYGGTVCVWDAGNNHCEGFIRAHFNSLDALGWSPDSRQIATASGAIRIWDSATGELSSSFGFYDGIIYKDLKWFDPQTIATLETSYTQQRPSMIRFWNLSTGNVKLAFRGWDTVEGLNNGGVMLVLDDVQVSSDRTLFQVSLRYDSPEVSMAGEWNLTMTDSKGNMYPLTNITPPDMDAGTTRVYQTTPVPVGEHIILDLNNFSQKERLPLSVDVSINPGKFTFDPNALQTGDRIGLDDFIDANGYTLHLIGAQKISDTELLFEFEADGYLNGAMLSAPAASGSSGGGVKNGTFTTLLSFAEMPKESFEVYVTTIYYNAFGPWSLDFEVFESMFTDTSSIASPVAIAPESTAPVYTSQDPLFLEVQSLLQKFNNSVTQQAGWVHILSEIITETTQEGQTYPPPYYQDEQWAEINSEGWVTRSLTTHSDRVGNVLQQSISSGTHNMNLTTGEAMEFPVVRFSLDGFLTDLDDALTHGQTALREDTICEDASPCLLITLTDGDFVRHTWINIETGQQVSQQTLQRMSDGTETILFTQNFLAVERVDAPPQDVLKLFSRVMFPVP